MILLDLGTNPGGADPENRCFNDLYTWSGWSDANDPTCRDPRLDHKPAMVASDANKEKIGCLTERK
jgi:hypothetical protein